jgi:AraC-like DNA-binding protein
MRLLNTALEDDVTGLLAALAVRSSVYCLSNLGAPWGFEVAGANVAKFHVVLDGACWLRVPRAAPIRLEHGDLAILPRGERHTVSDRPDSPVTGLDQLIDRYLDAGARLCCGGDGERTRLLCGGFTFAGQDPGTILALLPQVVTMTSNAAPVSAWIGPVLALARQEATTPAPGAQAIFAKLADLFLTQGLRSYLIGAAGNGLHSSGPPPDPSIAHAIALIRDHVDRRWTVEALARESGLSRTAFTAKFRAATGEPPIQHLAKVRLSQAAAYLTGADLTLDAIAARIGYASDASLSKAFKRHFGVSPGSYRAANRPQSHPALGSRTATA